MTTGRLNWYKGWRFLIDSFLLFRQNHPNAHLYFIGEGEDKDKITNYVAKVGLRDRVILKGPVCQLDVSAFINSADLFVMGSYTEGWSTSLVEAVACSRPCVVTDFSSAKELVKNGENGFVVEQRNEALFARKMEEALSLKQSIIQQYAIKAYSMSVQTMRKSLNDILQFE